MSVAAWALVGIGSGGGHQRKQDEFADQHENLHVCLNTANPYQIKKCLLVQQPSRLAYLSHTDCHMQSKQHVRHKIMGVAEPVIMARTLSMRSASCLTKMADAMWTGKAVLPRRLRISRLSLFIFVCVSPAACSAMTANALHPQGNCMLRN